MGRLAGNAKLCYWEAFDSASEGSFLSLKQQQITAEEPLILPEMQWKYLKTNSIILFEPHWWMLKKQAQDEKQHW